MTLVKSGTNLAHALPLSAWAAAGIAAQIAANASNKREQSTTSERAIRNTSVIVCSAITASWIWAQFQRPWMPQLPAPQPAPQPQPDPQPQPQPTPVSTATILFAVAAFTAIGVGWYVVETTGGTLSPQRA
jgi:hypothetical protein